MSRADSKLRDATPRQRGLAVVIDTTIPVFVAIPGVAALVLGSDSGRFTTTLLVTVTIVALCGWCALSIAMLVKRSQTIGKALQCIRVITIDGTPASFWQTLLGSRGTRVVRVED